MRLVLLHIFIFLHLCSDAQDKFQLSEGDIHSLGVAISDSTVLEETSLLQFSKFDSVVEKALSFQGVNYRYGGLSAKGLDCSGLVCLAYNHVNIALPRSSSALASIGTPVEADYLQKGDLIFFKAYQSNSIGHVALVSKIAEGLVYIVHATSSQGVIEEVLQENAYFMKRWLFNRRLD